LATREATLRMRSIEPTDVPPNFWTMSAKGRKRRGDRDGNFTGWC
jgi:hypothetical protein